MADSNEFEMRKKQIEIQLEEYEAAVNEARKWWDAWVKRNTFRCSRAGHEDDLMDECQEAPTSEENRTSAFRCSMSEHEND